MTTRRRRNARFRWSGLVKVAAGRCPVVGDPMGLLTATYGWSTP
jgi:hypothetical protein